MTVSSSDFVQLLPPRACSRLKPSANRETLTDPISINSFQSQVVSNINSIEAGHQCYLVNNLPTNAVAGTNATIQLKYWADPEDDGTQEVYYACADIVSLCSR